MKYGLAASTTTTRGLAQTLAKVKERVRIAASDTSQDAFLTDLINQKTAELEAETARAFITQRYVMYLDDFPDSDYHAIRLPVAPAASVASITYINTSGTTITWASSDYQTDFKQESGRVLPHKDASWPVVQDETLNAVVVTFTAGYGSTAADVPQIARHAIASSVVDTFQGCNDPHEAESYRNAVNLLKWEG